MEEESYRLVELVHWLDGKLAPDDARMAEMLKRAKGLAEGLTARAQPPIRVVDFGFFGSVVKLTAVEPCEDVDVLLVLDPDVLATQRGTQRTPMWTVAELRREVERLRAGLLAQGNIEVDSQRHSVGVRYPKSHMKVDLVPALRTTKRGAFLIPRRGDEEWIETWPEQDVKETHRLAKRHPPLRPAIRLLKSWKRLHGAPLSSYALSIALQQLVTEETFADPVALISEFWDRCASHDQRRRLHLGAEEGDGPLTLIHPKTGEDVLANKDAQDRRDLCDLSAEALEQLDGIRDRCYMGKPKWAAKGLSELFVGDEVQAEIDEIRGGNWYSGAEW